MIKFIYNRKTYIEHESIGIMKESFSTHHLFEPFVIFGSINLD